MAYPAHRRSRRASYDLAGERHHHLVVQDQAGRDARHNQVWNCLCDCGQSTTATTSQLMRGQKKSCGCRIGEAQRGIARPHTSLGQGIAARNKLVALYKRQARSRGYLWLLTLAECEALFQGPCFYCGAAPSQSFTTGVPNTFTGAYTYNGIDRVDNAKGYMATNVVSCCGPCNRAKGTRSLDEFVDWIDQIHNYLSAGVRRTA